MSTTDRSQESRYLESPYIIRDTNPGGQVPFMVKNPVGDVLSFTKKGFTTKRFTNGDAGKELSGLEDRKATQFEENEAF